MQSGVILTILGILFALWVLLRRDFVQGLSFAVFVWVSSTTWLRIQLPGSFPALTIHRLMLIVVTLAWLGRGGLPKVRSVPLLGCFTFWFLANLISLFGTQIDFATSFKTFLDFVLEVLVFYVVASTSLESREDAVRVLRAAWLGLIVVAIFAVVERHTGFNPVDRLIPGYERDETSWRVILSTYQHRILLGTAMAMGVPLSFVILQADAAAGKRLFFWIPVGLLLAACYYGQSRGPWLGLAIACGIMFVMGSREVKKKLAVIVTIGALMLVARPGVIKTLTHFAEDTMDANSFKGGTAQYRLELWRVAYHEVSKSPWLFLFGYGPSAGQKIQLDWTLSYRGTSYLIDSWDNHFAYSLFQSGFVGLAATLFLYLKGLMLFLKCWRSWPATRGLMSSLLATAAILIWMMTNVLVFAKQIDFLFWTVIAAGLVIAKSAETFSEDPVSEHDTEPAPESVAIASPVS
jgi:O-antigen ligase